MKRSSIVRGSLAALLGLLAWSGIHAPVASADDFDDFSVEIGCMGEVSASPADTSSVLSFLREYETTLARGRVDSIAQMYSDLEPGNRKVMERYFRDTVADLVVRLDHIKINVVEDLATVEFERRDKFTDRESGLPIDKSIDLQRRLRREGDGWKISLSSN